MAIIKSDSADLTINADGASSNLKLQIDGVEKASISSAGAFTSTTIDATALTGALPTIDGSNLTGVAPTKATIEGLGIAASSITGALPAISGASLTNLDASDLATGTVPTARLGTGTAGSGNFLRGDGAWEAAGGGKLVQMKGTNTGSTYLTSSSGSVLLDSLAFSSAHTTGNGVLVGYPIQTHSPSNADDCWLYFKLYDGATLLSSQGRVYFSGGSQSYMNDYICVWFGAVSSTATLTIKIYGEKSGASSTGVNTQDNANAFFIQEIEA